ncbi:RNA polymerase sigma factor [Flexithrix dorotheae]|uniref:RNA polymerase sigma factor n=1 Tax=Flexithrix dorotheae TaxID=70993 RepID=UPI00036865A8|nr:sigma-70 family RNA polymerase sigma factor [Flexithrix dorotheae]
MIFKIFSKPATLSDLELIRKYQESGEEKCIGELFDRYIDLVYAVCLKYLKNQEESKDAVMQIFEKLIIQLKNQDIQNFKSWLHVVAKNHCLMQLRAKKSEKSFESIEETQGLVMDSSLALHHDNEDELEKDLVLMEKGITALEENQKVCVELFYLKQKSYKEIAGITGFESKKVKSYIQNGKRKLKIFMEQQRE